MEPDYLYYALSVRRDELKRLGQVGTRTPIVNKSVFSGLRIPLPDVDAQRRIAGILSSYDDLIENCERRIRVLDEMARALYREWFVLFRYPGHQKAPLVDSALGRIPKGWGATTVSSASSFLGRGISPKYDENGPSVVINQKCIRDQRIDMDPARRQSKPIPDERRVRDGDVLINSTGVGTLGRVAQVLEGLGECTVDSHVTIVRPGREVDAYYLGLALLSLQPEFERKGVGATGQTELSRAAVGDVGLLLPPRECQRRFAEFVAPLRTATQTLYRRIKNFGQTRDLILPRLLSGKISVEDAA